MLYSYVFRVNSCRPLLLSVFSAYTTLYSAQDRNTHVFEVYSRCIWYVFIHIVTTHEYTRIRTNAENTPNHQDDKTRIQNTYLEYTRILVPNTVYSGASRNARFRTRIAADSSPNSTEFNADRFTPPGASWSGARAYLRVQVRSGSARDSMRCVPHRPSSMRDAA